MLVYTDCMVCVFCYINQSALEHLSCSEYASQLFCACLAILKIRVATWGIHTSKHIKGYSGSGPLCDWMAFSYSYVLFSNWNWLVCSSSVLNVACTWGCERLSVPSKPVCGMTLQNTLPAKGSVASKFLWRPLCLDFKKIR